MKHPFNQLTLQDVEDLRKKRSISPAGTVYQFTSADIHHAKAHLQTLYSNRVSYTYAERILLLNEIY